MDPSTNNTSFPYAPPDYFETVEAHPGLGVRFQKRGAWVKFGNSVQTLLVVLGTPDQVTTKHENKKIVAYSSTGGEGGAGRGGKFRPNDYFYNYFSLGVDILIDGEKHDVKKFVLHTNIPSHPLFSKYDRCNFQVQVQGGNPMGGLGLFFFVAFFSFSFFSFLFLPFLFFLFFPFPFLFCQFFLISLLSP